MITDTNNKFIIPFQYTHEEMKNDTVTEETRTVLFKACIRNLLLYKSITGGKDLFNALDEYKKMVRLSMLSLLQISLKVKL